MFLVWVQRDGITGQSLFLSNHSNAEMICIVLPSISTSRVCEKAISVRLSHLNSAKMHTTISTFCLNWGMENEKTKYWWLGTNALYFDMVK